MKKALWSRHLGSTGRSGQSLVELALGFTFLLFLLAGVIDIGRMYFTYIALEDGAGEAALFISINPGCIEATDDPNPTDGNPTPCAGTNNALWRATEAGGGMVNWNSPDTVITISCYTPYGVARECFVEKYDEDDGDKNGDGLADDGIGVVTGDMVRVEISYRYALIAPIIPEIAGSDTIRLTGRASEEIVGFH